MEGLSFSAAPLGVPNLAVLTGRAPVWLPLPEVPSHPSASLHDDDLLAAFVAGDRAAIELVVRCSTPIVEKAVRSTIRDRFERDDAVQEALLKLAELHDRFRGGSFPSYVYRFAFNVAVDHLRRLKNTPVPVGSDAEEAGPSIEENFASLGNDADHEELLEDVRRFVDGLSDVERQVLELSYVEGIGRKRVSDVLGVSQPKSRKLIDRVRAKVATFTRGRKYTQ
jgi:RNA polymerase sigma-70 factor (ECF subfamily)